MVGVWIQVLYEKMQSTFKINEFPIGIIELGPGTGELALDILRTLYSLRKSLNGLSYEFVEVSPKLRSQQQEKLLKFVQQTGNYMTYKKHDTENPPFKNTESFTCEDKKSNFSMAWTTNLKELTYFDIHRLKNSKQYF